MCAALRGSLIGKRTIVHDVAHEQVAANGDVLEQREVGGALVDNGGTVVRNA